MLGKMFKSTRKLTTECHLLKAVSPLLLSRTATDCLDHSLQMAPGNRQSWPWFDMSPFPHHSLRWS